MKFKRGLKKRPGKLKHFLKLQGYNQLQTRVGLTMIILVIALIMFSGYFLFFYAKPVETNQEFADSMTACKRVSWIKDDASATWVYTIKGNAEGDACNIEVKLLKMKEGTIDSEVLQGKKMTCIVLKSETQFPEKDISKCTGELKGELQDIIIQRMHNYLLKNVGEIKQEFEGL